MGMRNHHLRGPRLSWMHDLALASLFAFAAAFAMDRCHAQIAVSSLLAQRLNLAAPVVRAPIFPFLWPLRFSKSLDYGPTPLYAAIGDFLGRTPDGSARQITGANGMASPATRVMTSQYLGADRPVDSTETQTRGNSFAEQRPDLQDGATGELSAVRFVRYRLPWLVTPETAVPGLPTLTMRSGDAVSFELMGGTMGGRSGAYGQLVVRF